MINLLTKAERLKAAYGNIKNWDYSITPFKLEEQDARVIVEALKDYRHYCDMGHEGVFYDDRV